MMGHFPHGPQLSLPGICGLVCSSGQSKGDFCGSFLTCVPVGVAQRSMHTCLPWCLGGTLPAPSPAPAPQQSG